MSPPIDPIHESRESLSDELVDRHRATRSLIEELEAIDWYDQRIAACTDPALRAILTHNRNEEGEHAAMLLEWLRKQRPELDAYLRAHLFRTTQEPAEEERAQSEAPAAMSLGIGTLMEKPR